MAHHPSSQPLEGSQLALAAACDTLRRAEHRISLFPRATPKDPALERASLAKAVQRRERARPSQRQVPRLDLSALRRALERLAGELSGRDPVATLVAERARELELEAALSEALFTSDARALAARRFPAPGGRLAHDVLALVDRALADPAPVAAREHTTDDLGDPKSLCSLLRRRSLELGLRLRIEVRPEQLAVAATGEGLVAVRPRVRLSAAASERIAAHELHGHALPRARALHASSPVFRAGTAGAAEHEEGRALLVEARLGLLDAERARELALRHRAALAARDGALPEETARRLVELGAPLEQAVDIAIRVHRGGGLAREIVYLPAYLEVARALAEQPKLEAWLERGRVDLRAARMFERGRPSVARARRRGRPARTCRRRQKPGTRPASARSQLGGSSSFSTR